LEENNMKKDFLDALIEQLEALKAEDNQPNVGKVVALVIHTAVNQKLTFDVKRDILEALMSLDGITPDEAELLRDLDRQEGKAQ